MKRTKKAAIKALEHWKNILAIGDEATAAYDALLAACRKLSGELEKDYDYVLQKVMPKEKAERDYSARIMQWLKGEQCDWDSMMCLRHECKERADLIKRLNLTDDEKYLLHIEEADEDPNP